MGRGWGERAEKGDGRGEGRMEGGDGVKDGGMKDGGMEEIVEAMIGGGRGIKKKTT